jgi:hypothetical protein
MGRTLEQLEFCFERIEKRETQPPDAEMHVADVCSDLLANQRSLAAELGWMTSSCQGQEYPEEV